MRKTYRIKLSELVSDYNKDYAIANLSYNFIGYDPQFTEGNGFITFAVNSDEHLTNEIIREKLSSSSFVSAVSSGDYKKRIIKVPKLKEAGQGSWNKEHGIWQTSTFPKAPAKNPMTDKQHNYVRGLFSRKDYSAHPYANVFAFHEKNIEENTPAYSKYHASTLIDSLKDFPDKVKEASSYPDFAHGKGINGTPLTDTASNNPFTTEQGKSGVDAGLEIPDTENVQYLIGQDDIRNPGGGRYSEPQKIIASSWVIAKEEEKEKKVDQYGLPIPEEDKELPKGRTLADLWGGISGMGTSADKTGND